MGYLFSLSLETENAFVRRTLDIIQWRCGVCGVILTPRKFWHFQYLMHFHRCASRLQMHTVSEIILSSGCSVRLGKVDIQYCLCIQILCGNDAPTKYTGYSSSISGTDKQQEVINCKAAQPEDAYKRISSISHYSAAHTNYDQLATVWSGYTDNAVKRR